MAATLARFRSPSAAPCIRSYNIPHDLLLNRRRSRQRDVPELCIALQVHVLQQAAKMFAALHRRSYTAGNIKVPQEMDVIGDGYPDDRVKRDHQRDVDAGLLQLLRNRANARPKRSSLHARSCNPEWLRLPARLKTSGLRPSCRYSSSAARPRVGQFPATEYWSIHAANRLSCVSRVPVRQAPPMPRQPKKPVASTWSQIVTSRRLCNE